MSTLPADWETLDLYIWTPTRFGLPESPGPYNLLGLKGLNARELKRAWQGEPKDDPDAALRPLMLPASLCFIGLILVITGAGNGHFWSDLLRPTGQQWLGYALFLLGSLWVSLPSPAERRRRAEAEVRERAASQKDCVTVELRLPGRGRRLTRIRRRRGMTPLWTSPTLSGCVLVTLEGLTPQEIEAVTGAVYDLNPQP